MRPIRLLRKRTTQRLVRSRLFRACLNVLTGSSGPEKVERPRTELSALENLPVDECSLVAVQMACASSAQAGSLWTAPRGKREARLRKAASLVDNSCQR